METLETIRAAAPALLFVAVALALIVWVVMALAQGLEAAEDEFADIDIDIDIDADVDARPTVPPASEILQSSPERAILGLAVGIVVGEALFALHKAGVL